MLSQTVQVKRKKPQVAPESLSEPTKLEKNREAKRLREKWLVEATEEELKEALKMKLSGPPPPGPCYILHSIVGPINYCLVKNQLDIRFPKKCSKKTKEELEKESIAKKIQREENKLYALNICNKQTRLQILNTNFEKLSKQLETSSFVEDLKIKLNRITQEINKIKK